MGRDLAYTRWVSGPCQRVHRLDPISSSLPWKIGVVKGVLPPSRGEDRIREVKRLAQGHAASWWWCLELDSGGSEPQNSSP